MSGRTVVFEPDKFTKDFRTFLFDEIVASKDLLLRENFIPNVLRVVQAAADTEADKVLQFISRSFVGRIPGNNPGSIGTISAPPNTIAAGKFFKGVTSGSNLVVGRGGLLKWEKLLKSTINKKKKIKDPRGKTFFFQTGRFKKILTSKTGTGRFGKTKVSFIKAQGRSSRFSGHIHVNIFPKIVNSVLAFRPNGSLSSIDPSAGLENLFGPLFRTKARNPRGQHRPLVQPIVAYWIAVMVPAAIFRALERKKLVGLEAKVRLSRQTIRRRNKGSI